MYFSVNQFLNCWNGIIVVIHDRNFQRSRLVHLATNFVNITLRFWTIKSLNNLFKIYCFYWTRSLNITEQLRYVWKIKSVSGIIVSLFNNLSMLTMPNLVFLKYILTDRCEFFNLYNGYKSYTKFPQNYYCLEGLELCS